MRLPTKWGPDGHPTKAILLGSSQCASTGRGSPSVLLVRWRKMVGTGRRR